MRIRYDIYVEFDSPRENAKDAVLEVAKGAFGDGVMGISASSLYEDNYILTAMLYLDPALIFDDIEERFPDELPENMEARLEKRLDKYKDGAIQRVES
jgi:hypothetical protein